MFLYDVLVYLTIREDRCFISKENTFTSINEYEVRPVGFFYAIHEHESNFELYIV